MELEKNIHIKEETEKTIEKYLLKFKLILKLKNSTCTFELQAKNNRIEDNSSC